MKFVCFCFQGGPQGAAANFEELRIVTIEGLDANPCGGTHLRSTAEIQVNSVTIITVTHDLNLYVVYFAI